MISANLIEAEIAEKVNLFKDKEKLVKSHLIKLCKMLSDLDTMNTNTTKVLEVNINTESEVLYKMQYFSIIQQCLLPSMMHDLSNDRGSLHQITKLLDEHYDSEIYSAVEQKLMMEDIENLENLLLTREEALKALDNLLNDINSVLTKKFRKEEQCIEDVDVCEKSEDTNERGKVEPGDETTVNKDDVPEQEEQDELDNKCFTPTCILA